MAGLVLVDAFSARMPEFMGSKYPPYDVVLNTLSGDPLSRDPAFEQYDVLASVKLADAVEGFSSADVESAWSKVQAALAKLVPDTPHIIAEGSDYYIQVREPDLVTSTVVLILERIRAEE